MLKKWAATIRIYEIITSTINARVQSVIPKDDILQMLTYPGGKSCYCWSTFLLISCPLCVFFTDFLACSLVLPHCRRGSFNGHHRYVSSIFLLYCLLLMFMQATWLLIYLGTNPEQQAKVVGLLTDHPLPCNLTMQFTLLPLCPP
jgi:hypothetical protein